MSKASSTRPLSLDPPALHDRALDNLRYIRETMERAVSITAVPGWGGVAMGVTAFVAAAVASHQSRFEAWLITWISAALVALLIGGWAMFHKARAARFSVLSGPARNFAISFSTPILIGALLTIALYRTGARQLIPSLWLLLYGTAVVTGGAFSVKIVPLMGVCFISLGVLALVTPASWGNGILAVGFGGLQIIFGVLIGRKYGG